MTCHLSTLGKLRQDNDELARTTKRMERGGGRRGERQIIDGIKGEFSEGFV